MDASKIREIVDSIGWEGLRRDYPALWAEIKKEREAARKYVDNAEEFECRRVFC